MKSTHHAHTYYSRARAVVCVESSRLCDLWNKQPVTRNGPDRIMWLVRRPPNSLRTDLQRPRRAASSADEHERSADLPKHEDGVGQRGLGLARICDRLA